MAFRIAAFSAGLFSLALVLIFTVIYNLLSANLLASLRDHVSEVSNALATMAENGGPDNVKRVVTRRAADTQIDEDIYLYTDRDGNYLAGNIEPIPRFTGWKTIPWSELPLVGGRHNPASSTAVIGRWSSVKDGYLFAADGNGDINEARSILFKGLGWGVLLAALSSVAAGLAIGFSIQRRVLAMETALGAISRGELDVRVARDSSQDDMDHVASLINGTLDRLQRLIGGVKQVTTDIAHDLRTPINHIRHRLELVQVDGAGSAEYQAAVDETIIELDAIVDTFEALLRIAEIEGGARKAQFVSVDLKGLLLNVVDALEAVAKDSNHVLTTNLDSSREVRVQGDIQLLNQLFVNLIDNSIRHCPRGSEIRVELLSHGRAPVVSVLDNGPGIPEEEHEKVFRRLYRLEKSRTTAGSGLGLSLVAAIVELHGAEITLEDCKPGLKARVRFPAA